MSIPFGGGGAGELDLGEDDTSFAALQRPLPAAAGLIPQLPAPQAFLSAPPSALVHFSPAGFGALPTARPPASNQQVRNPSKSNLLSPGGRSAEPDAEVVAVQSVTSHRIPGPAGQGAAGWHPSPRSTATGQGAGLDADFCSSAWLAALHMLGLNEFDERHALLHGATVRAARSMAASGMVGRLLVYVISVQRAYNGECLIQLKDPSGVIAGTLTSDVLEHDPDIRRGNVLLLQKVTVLWTPPPGALHHLCITPENICQVIPAARQRPTMATPAFPAFPALPAPVSFSALGPTPPATEQLQPQLQAVAQQPQPQQPSNPFQHPPSSQPSNLATGPAGNLLGDRRHNLVGTGFGLPQKSQPALVQLDNGIDDLLAGLDEEFAL